MTLSVKASKRFNEFHLQVDFSIGRDIVVLFGPSGAGKSLTLKLIAGLLTPDEGEIIFEKKSFFSKKELVNVPPQKRGIGYVFQNHTLFPHMTVLENILYGFKGCSSLQGRQLAQDLLEKFKIEHRRNNYPAEISGGEQQRVALARSIIRKPKMLLLDESFNNLDSAAKAGMHKYLKDVHAELQIPIIFVTHDIFEARFLARKMLVIVDGVIVQSGNIQDIERDPTNEVVSQLVRLPEIF